ncbi:hypothetical protein AMAG_14392 [Allomyces macrogynus ATCC 38327]|uniref:TmcB/TmcC TPR repeats domain-containing protein n=1 Tax=Allomyces macrogynus (strain ATCC 38327) TaxID=578462 RepID=A0A0L0T6P8_ALLM3|nr:hypothetical protein AMAG_14392 [Allomyces macrogynus ATCC 38327]|eukprot:KNE70239.1 hypothetical protein AMAG_14392 [Allomyces macrogynus ATCC 38327]
MANMPTESAGSALPLHGDPVLDPEPHLVLTAPRPTPRAGPDLAGTDASTVIDSPLQHALRPHAAPPDPATYTAHSPRRTLLLPTGNPPLPHPPTPRGLASIQRPVGTLNTSPPQVPVPAPPSPPPVSPLEHNQKLRDSFESGDAAHYSDGAAAAAAAAAASRRGDKLPTMMALSRLENAIFSVAYVTVRDNELPAKLCWFLMVLEDLQLLSFSLAPRLDSSIPWLLLVIVEPLRLVQTYGDFVIVNIIALLTIVITLGLAFYVGMMVVRAAHVPILALRVLRLLFAIQMTALSIPVAQILLGGLHCVNGVLVEFHVPCYSGVHAPLFVLDLFLDTQPNSHSPDAKAHGRMDFQSVLSRIYFVFCDIFTSYTAHPDRADWWYMTLISVGLAYLAARMVHTQPYFNATMTALRAGFATGSLFGMLAAMATYATALHNAWLIVTVPAMAGGFFVGAGVSYGSARYLFERSVRRWHRARKRDAQAIAAGERGGAPAEAPPVTHEAPALAGLARRMLKRHASLKPSACLRFIRAHPTSHQVTLGLQLLEQGLMQFDDPLLMFLAAMYLQTYFGEVGKVAAAELLEAVKRRSVAVDLKFLLYAHDRQVMDMRKTAGMGGNEPLQVLENAELQNLDRKSKHEHLQSLLAVREVFECLRTGTPAAQLSEAVGKMSHHRAEANRCYARLLERFPKSKSILRSYAQFLFAVEGNAAKATQILEMAEARESRVPMPGSGGGSHVRSYLRLDEFPPPGDGLPLSHDTPQDARTPLDMSRRSGFRVGSASESGSTGSRAMRHKLQNRKLLYERAAAPLMRVVPLYALAALYFACLLAGVFLSLNFFDDSVDVVANQFNLAKNARRVATELVDGLHHMAYADRYAEIPAYTAQMQVEYADAIDRVRTAVAYIGKTALAFLATEPAMAATTWRAYVRTNTTVPGAVDYVAGDWTTMDLVAAVYQAGQVAVEYTRMGEFATRVVQGAHAVAFVIGNYEPIFQAISSIPDLGLAALIDLMNASFSVILGVLVAAVTALLAAVAYLFVTPLAGYFRIETHLLRALRTLPKRAATEAVTAIDVEIELYRDVQGLDDEADAVVPAAAASSDAAPRPARQTVIARWAVAVTAVLTAITVGMFLFPLWGQTTPHEMRVMLASTQRRQDCRIIALQLRYACFDCESHEASECGASESTIQSLALAAYDLQQHHTAVTNDATGVDAILPHLTNLAMPCTATDPATVARCNVTLSGYDDPATIKFNPTLPVNQAVWTFLDAVAEFVELVQPGHELLPGTLDPVVVRVPGANITVNPMTPRSHEYLRLQKQATDILARLGMVDDAMVTYAGAQLAVARSGCLVMFVATVGVAVAACVVVRGVVLGKLRDKAAALVSVVFLVPSQAVKDCRKLHALVETGGLPLMRVGTEDGER